MIDHLFTGSLGRGNRLVTKDMLCLGGHGNSMTLMMMQLTAWSEESVQRIMGDWFSQGFGSLGRNGGISPQNYKSPVIVLHTRETHSVRGWFSIVSKQRACWLLVFSFLPHCYEIHCKTHKHELAGFSTYRVIVEWLFWENLFQNNYPRIAQCLDDLGKLEWSRVLSWAPAFPSLHSQSLSISSYGPTCFADPKSQGAYHLIVDLMQCKSNNREEQRKGRTRIVILHSRWLTLISTLLPGWSCWGCVVRFSS